MGAALADVDDDDFKMEASNLLALKDSLADALIFDWEAVDDAALFASLLSVRKFVRT